MAMNLDDRQFDKVVELSADNIKAFYLSVEYYEMNNIKVEAKKAFKVELTSKVVCVAFDWLGS